MNTSSCRILVVEDNPDDEYLTRRALRGIAESFDVQIARDGAHAISLITSPGFAVDLVLLDIKLPKFSGLEVLRAARSTEQGAEWPIVMLTSSDDPGERSKCMAEGANDFVTKPLDTDLYMKCVATAAARWLDESRSGD